MDLKRREPGESVAYYEGFMAGLRYAQGKVHRDIVSPLEDEIARASLIRAEYAQETRQQSLPTEKTDKSD